MRESQNRDMVIGFTLKIQSLNSRCLNGPRGEMGLKEKRGDGTPPFLAAGKNWNAAWEEVRRKNKSVLI